MSASSTSESALRERAEDHPVTQKGNSIDRIAAWAGALAAGQVPPAAVALAKKAFLDTLAVSLSGSQLELGAHRDRAGARARPGGR